MNFSTIRTVCRLGYLADFKIIIDYLESTLKIITDDNGVVSYIWNPELLEKIKNRPEIKI